MFKIFNSKMYVAVLMFLSTMVFSGVMAHAQTTDVGVKVQIPFKFTVENTTLPAGDYTIAPKFDEAPTLDMRNPSKDVNILLVAETVHETMKSEKPELVFDNIGGRDFLRVIKTDNKTFVLSKYSQQIKLEKQGEKAQSHNVPCTKTKGKGMASANPPLY